MRRLWKKGLSFVLAVIMVASLLPTTALAAVDNATGMPKDVNNTLVLAIYTGDGFPGEPAVYGTEKYKNINSSFAVKSGSTFANTATSQLDWSKIEKDIVQGAASSNTYVWGVYDANGTKDYFLPNASIIQPANEAKIIRAVKNLGNNVSDEAILNQYEIIWYVIKLQHSPGSYWWSSGTTEWHIDGVIKEKKYVSVNYYGNGNTSGAAPLGTTSLAAGDAYTVLGKNTMVKKINGVEVAFLGWSAKADGTGAEAGFYQPGDVIKPTESLSLYAMWDTTTQYTATVNTYLDGKLTSEKKIHGTNRNLYLSTDEEHYYALSEGDDGVYTTKITGNGKFYLYNKNSDGTYTQVGNRQLTIYNQNASLDVHHYSVTYDPNGGSFASAPEKEVYYYGNAVTAISDIPVKAGYRFIGWKVGDSALIKSGETVTSSITEPITLTAQWEKTVNVTVNVTINHAGGDGYDQMETKDDVFMALVSRADSTSAYLETGDTLTLNKASHVGFGHSESNNTTNYTATGPVFTDLPGGSAEYTVVTSKSGYDTSVEANQDANGNWVVNVVMTYKPTNFDLDFTVTVDESVPAQYLPDAAIVKVTFWSSDRNAWEIITQQEGGNPGVRVDIDPKTRSGFGSYPVWKYESTDSNPYGYRIEITSFVYPDGTIVPVSKVLKQDVQWTDEVYTATAQSVTGGKKYGELDGAYFSDNTGKQEGVLIAEITMGLYDVTFDAQGGKVNGQNEQLVEDQYKIPGFKDYVPVREGGYTFDGWYEDQACTVPATEEENLTKDITLYAKWIAPLTVSGIVTISGTYQQNGETVSVHDIDRATEAVVVLQELRNGNAVEVDSQAVSFGNYQNSGSADYSFTGIPNDGKTYQIHILVLNYGTTYDNESDSGTSYSADEYIAVFGGDRVADVDAYLEFVPPSYVQDLLVDATQIGAGFRPDSVLAKVIYRDVGDNHPYQVISQHDVPPYGVEIDLDADGNGDGTQSIWKWHTDGTLYDYQMSVTEVDGVEFDGDTAPFYIMYAAPAYWNSNTDQPSGDLEATLIPKEYLITFDLNAGGDAVTGMDDLDDGNGTYQTIHTWSFDTEVNAAPERAGYTFLGWEADVVNAYDGEKIDASIHQNVVLTAKWEKISAPVLHTVITAASPAEGGTTSGDGTYTLGANVTVTAEANENYQFAGWYENGEKVSDDMEYSFTVTGDHALTAKFTNTAVKKNYKIVVEAKPKAAGTVSGGGTYEEGTEIILTADVNEGYTFAGWFSETEELITADYEFSHVVTKDRHFKARYNRVSDYENGYAYIFGYSNSVMGAEGPLLRGEAAVMVHRLVKQNNGRGDFVYDAANPSFADIAGEWFQCGIEYIHYRGGFSVPEGTNVGPYVQITRGEVFKIVTLGLGFTQDTTLTHDEYGAILADYGYIIGSGGSGYLDSGSLMTRAEFCTMYNRIIGRANAVLEDKEGNLITAETYGFTDLSPKQWYYEDMLRATSAYEDGYVSISKRAIRNVVDDYS